MTREEAIAANSLVLQLIGHSHLLRTLSVLGEHNVGGQDLAFACTLAEGARKALGVGIDAKFVRQSWRSQDAFIRACSELGLAAKQRPTIGQRWAEKVGIA